jgi:hypothetical protein
MNHGMKVSRRKTTGETKKVTISLQSSELETMRRFAKQRHRGNLSGAFAELVAHAARLEAMDRVLAELPQPSALGLARLESELAGRPPAPKKKKAA